MSVERDVNSVLRESEAFFGGRGAVHRTLRALASRLDADISFPVPESIAIDRGGIRVVPLETLLELKIPSGLSAEHRRLLDLADVQRAIEVLRLPKELGERLHPSVRAEYGRLWALAQRTGEGPVER